MKPHCPGSRMILTVGRMRTAAHGGTFDFPDWASGLFGLLMTRLFAATDGATDPCVGEDLIQAWL